MADKKETRYYFTNLYIQGKVSIEYQINSPGLPNTPATTTDTIFIQRVLVKLEEGEVVTNELLDTKIKLPAALKGYKVISFSKLTPIG